MKLWRRILFRWRRDELYRELEEEIEFHRLLGDVVLPQWKSSVGIIVGALIAVMISAVAIPTTFLWIIPALLAVRHHSRKWKEEPM